MDDASFSSLLLGGGVDVHLNQRWDVTAGVVRVPGKSSLAQERTMFSSGGFRYTMRPLPDARVAAARDTTVVFPRHVLQVEYFAPTGYELTHVVSSKVPIFWNGEVQADFGISPHYERNVFHSRRLFALDVGTSVGVYRTRQDRQRFFTMSIYPLVRVTFMRARAFDAYVNYSVAGPTFISHTHLDRLDTGRHFTLRTRTHSKGGSLRSTAPIRA